jgi:hypothetical protein
MLKVENASANKTTNFMKSDKFLSDSTHPKYPAEALKSTKPKKLGSSKNPVRASLVLPEASCIHKAITVYNNIQLI